MPCRNSFVYPYFTRTEDPEEIGSHLTNHRGVIDQAGAKAKSSSLRPIMRDRGDWDKKNCQSGGREMKFIEPLSVFAADRQLHANMLLTFR